MPEIAKTIFQLLISNNFGRLFLWIVLLLCHPLYLCILLAKFGSLNFPIKRGRSCRVVKGIALREEIKKPRKVPSLPTAWAIFKKVHLQNIGSSFYFSLKRPTWVSTIIATPFIIVCHALVIKVTKEVVMQLFEFLTDQKFSWSNSNSSKPFAWLGQGYFGAMLSI